MLDFQMNRESYQILRTSNISTKYGFKRTSDLYEID
jgi:hypothetical protein